MYVRELLEALDVFKPGLPLEVLVTEQGKPDRVLQLRTVGHIHHPGEVKTDHTIHALDLIADHWTQPPATGDAVDTLDKLATLAQAYPAEMHVRVVVPMAHPESDSIMARALDVVRVGRQVGSSPGAKVQLITEDWSFAGPIYIEDPERAAARLQRESAAT